MGAAGSPWKAARRPEITVRSVARGDAEVLGEIFHRAVHEGTQGAYTDEQRAAWAPRVPSGPDWEARLSGLETVLAEMDGRTVGFMSLDLAKGYLNFTYVLPEAQGSGVADAMYLVLESRARLCGWDRLTSDASHLAKPFLIRHGWDVVSSQTVERMGVTLENWRMEKRFPPSPGA